MKRYTSKIKRKRGYTRRNKKKNNFKGSRKKHRRKGTTRKNKKLIFNMRGGAYKFNVGPNKDAQIPEPMNFNEDTHHQYFDMLKTIIRDLPPLNESLSIKEKYDFMFKVALEKKIIVYYAGFDDGAVTSSPNSPGKISQINVSTVEQIASIIPTSFAFLKAPGFDTLILIKLLG